MKNKRSVTIAVLLSGLLLLVSGIWLYRFQNIPETAIPFSDSRAYQDVVTQVGFGPRIPDSAAHAQTIKYIQSELKKAGWSVSVLEQTIQGHTAYNILATRNSTTPVILFGAHYDSRLWANQDKIAANRQLPVPGADDGASGVAVQLELARTLPASSVPIGLLFIDIEDNGEIPGWDWLLGSQVFADNMTFTPNAVVILDMIGDSDLNVYQEWNSDAGLNDQIWNSAKSLGYDSAFIPQHKYTMLDDHIPFIKKGLRAVDLIDFDYPYWHTTQDTSDKVSASSLGKVGRTLLAWVRDYGPCLSQGTCTK